MVKKFKVFSLVVFGNIIDYYDFLLFAHLGAMITSVFIPHLDAKQTHLISLFFFGLPFVVRPLGGYIFGLLADAHGKREVLVKALKVSSMATLGIALLPSYESLGFLSIILFTILRGLQGFSLGGEYTTAGSFLMEHYVTRRGMVSGILCASGTVGSLMALLVSYLYIKGHLTGSDWRYFFLLAFMGTAVASFLRKSVILPSKQETVSMSEKSYPGDIRASWLIFLAGALISILCWIPMVYANFYFTKELHYAPMVGMQATFLALVGYVVFNIFCGKLADYFSAKSVMTWGALLCVPLGLMGYGCMMKGYMVGQLFLIAAASLFGAPFHLLAHQIFHPSHQVRNINTSFMIGTSIGGMTPFLAGYIHKQFGYAHAPAVLIVLVGFLTFISFSLILKRQG